MPDDRVSEGDERVVEPTPVNDDALLSDPSSTSLVDRVSEGDGRVIESTITSTITEDCSLAISALPSYVNESVAPDATPANDDALFIDPSSTSLVDRVSEGDVRVV